MSLKLWWKPNFPHHRFFSNSFLCGMDSTAKVWLLGYWAYGEGLSLLMDLCVSHDFWLGHAHDGSGPGKFYPTRRQGGASDSWAPSLILARVLYLYWKHQTALQSNLPRTGFGTLLLNPFWPKFFIICFTDSWNGFSLKIIKISYFQKQIQFHCWVSLNYGSHVCI